MASSPTDACLQAQKFPPVITLGSPTLCLGVPGQRVDCAQAPSTAPDDSTALLYITIQSVDLLPTTPPQVTVTDGTANQAFTKSNGLPNCVLTIPAPWIVKCTPLKNPLLGGSWDCPDMLVGASADGITGAVNGTTQCNNDTIAWTGDVGITNPTWAVLTANLGTVAPDVECGAYGILDASGHRAPAPLPPYTVNCLEPGSKDVQLNLN